MSGWSSLPFWASFEILHSAKATNAVSSVAVGGGDGQIRARSMPRLSLGSRDRRERTSSIGTAPMRSVVIALKAGTTPLLVNENTLHMPIELDESALGSELHGLLTGLKRGQH